MKTSRRLCLSFVVAAVGVALCELAAFGGIVDCSEKEPRGDSCADCKLRFCVAGAPTRCAGAMDAGVCSGYVPNSTKSCEDSTQTCAGPLYIYDTEDSTCDLDHVDTDDTCPALICRKFPMAVEGTASSSCD